MEEIVKMNAFKNVLQDVKSHFWEMEFVKKNAKQQLVILIVWIVKMKKLVLKIVLFIDLEIKYVTLLVIINYVNETKEIVKYQNYAIMYAK